MCCCARSQAPVQQTAKACGILAQSLANQESAFVARVRAIRATHILLREYDRQMIALLSERRKTIESALLMGTPADLGVSGCSGQELKDLRLEAQNQMRQLQEFLDTFRQGLREDPEGVFIDER